MTPAARGLEFEGEDAEPRRDHQEGRAGGDDEEQPEGDDGPARDRDDQPSCTARARSPEAFHGVVYSGSW